MALSFSTALRNQMLTTGSFKSIMDGSVIRFYNGPVPTGVNSADVALGGGNTLLLEVSVGGTGTGVTWQTPAANGVITKNLSESWTGNVATGGTPTFFRIVKPADAGGSLGTEVRVQGTAGAASADMILTNSLLVSGTPQALQYGQIAIPSL